MNDPGLDASIADASDQVKENVTDQVKENAINQHKWRPNDGMDEEEEEKSFLLPARWWYASTGFPLLAGTFGPMASAFSICALVENWRVEIPLGGTEEHGIDIKDPKWLIAVNAVSLVCALTANLSLLLNMASRFPFKIAQPVTIIGFWLASILLIALIAVASHNFHASGIQDQALTQAYYYAVFAAGLYQIISYLMCVTVYGAYKGHYSGEFKLTMAQRTLMLQTIAFLVYQLLGALVFSHIEGWKFLDAVYWADFTSLTIGIGADYVPKTHLGRGLLFPFAIGGITILGLVVGSIRSLILDRGKRKMAARLTEKTRARLIREIQKTVANKHRPHRHGVLRLEKDTIRALTLQPGEGELSEVDRREAEFQAMRRVQDRAVTMRKYYSLLVSTFAFAFLWIIGALVFSRTEKNQQWTYFQSLYFSYTTLLTIGYGDFQPISNSGKPFFVFWSLLAIPTLTILISDMGETVVKAIKEGTIWLGEITVLPSDQEGTKERLKYGLYKMTLGKVDTAQSKPRDPEEAGQGQIDSKSSFQELQPGLARMFKRRGSKEDNQQHIGTEDRLAAEFEESEKIDESIARGRGERSEEDEHHYRHVLISQIRKVYADSSSATPKKYSYAEWAYFLKLLGEDESNSSLHRRPPSPTRAKADDMPNDAGGNLDPGTQRQKAFEAGGQESAHAPANGRDPDGNEEVTKWSWIGNRSPLMGDRDEPEWLLEKLFQRLEESLRDLKREKEEPIKQETAEHPRGKKLTTRRESSEGSSSNRSSKDQPQVSDEAGEKS